MGSLLAKSGDGAPTVARHCRDVRETGDAIWAAVADDLRTLVPGLGDRFARLRAVAELLHDVLKANSAYQTMVESSGRSPERQPVRHEVLAAAFLSGDGPLAAWFAGLIPDVFERWAVTWAVGGHHFKMTDPSREPYQPLYRDAGAATSLTLYLAHEDVRAVLSDAASLNGPSETPQLSDLWYKTVGEELRDRIDDYVSAAVAAWDRLQRVPANRTFVGVLKALVAAADAAGSAVTERGESPAVWVQKALGCRLTPADLEPVVQRDLKGKKPRPFQQLVANSDKLVTVVAAGCGNGKTTAAYLWAQRWADGKKLFFSYPTTGTATAGYGNYLAAQQGLPTELIHGKSDIDLAAMRVSRDDDALDTAARIESLRAWTPKVVVCTVDTVLGLLQTQRRGVYSFPAFVAGAFVFDEVHSYDAKLWGGLLRFLKEFPGVPALLMSASIPPQRRQQLRDVLGDRFGDVILGDANLEGHKRYRLQARAEADCWDDVVRALGEGKKVLWVCNTVGDAIRVARDAAARTAVKPIIYHSRFRYRDRVARQNQLVAAFGASGPLLAVTTQVCEMSLDISAHLMVTAECPLTSLVQRLGRLNRYAEGDDPWPCLVVPFRGLPYNEEPTGIDLYGDCIASMAATRSAVSELGGQPCSQRDLADRLGELVDGETPETYSALFDDGWVTEPMPVRDGDQSVTVIRAADLPEIEQRLGTNRKFWSAGKLAPWTIPMAYRRGLKLGEPVGPYPVASDDVLSYREQEGAEWLAKNPQ